MPIQIDRRPSEPREPVDARAATAKQQAQHQQHHAHQQHQQQIAHREALRLALGSILTPLEKRPSSAAPSSRPSSGTASPAHPFAHAMSASGTHTPSGTPPVGHYGYFPHAQGDSGHLHPHSIYGHGHGHQPSRLGPSRTTSSSTPSPSGSAHPSPRVGDASAVAGVPLPPSGLEPLPPAMCVDDGVTAAQIAIPSKPVRPSIMPLHPSTEHVPEQPHSHAVEHDGASVPGSGSGTSTPRAKFLQTLQSKSAWDALIHGSFS